jgi:hydrogenase maturation protease
VHKVKDRVLVIGYGNPGRLDDGLGPALAAALEAEGIPGITVETRYQLSIEDAAAVAEHDCVIFADAARTGPEPFALERIAPAGPASFSSHAVKPEAILALAEGSFGSTTKGYVLAVRGYSFDAFGESLSEKARKNLDSAIRFMREKLQDGGWNP